MTFRPDDGDKDKFDESLHYPSPLKFDKSLHYIAPLRTPVLPEKKYYTKKHLECKSLYFNGSNSYINAGNNATVSFGIGVNFTLALYVKIKKFHVAEWSRLLEKRPADAAKKYALSVGTEADPSIKFTLLGSNLSSGTILINKWYHIIITRNGLTGRIYINGKLSTSGALVDSASGINANLIIGRKDGGNDFLNGNLSTLKIYRRSISSEESLKLSDNKSISQTNLVLDLGLTSNYSGKTIIHDKSENGNNGTLYNCEWDCDWIRKKYKVI